MRQYILYLCFFLFITSACSTPRTFFPDRVNTPLLTKQGDARASVTAKLQIPNGTQNDDDQSFDIFSPQLDASYAVTNNIGLIMSLRTMINHGQPERGEPSDPFFSDIGGRYNGYRADVGAGVFSTIGNKGLFEFYGGVGYGQLNRTGRLLPQFDYTTQYYRLFIQPSAAFFVRKGYTIIWGLRLTYQDYIGFDSKDPNMIYYVTTEDFFADYPEGNGLLAGNYFFTEPFVGFQFGGWDWLKVDLQAGFNISLINSYFNRMPTAGHVDIGLTFMHPFGRNNKMNKSL